MSNTCNAPGCRNDRRYKERLLIMPHVMELKFHTPRRDEYLRWENKLEREDYKVSSTTKVCSNHFKYGKPLHSSRIPSQYMRGYPDWALPADQAIVRAKECSDDIICQILAHVLQYLNPSITSTVIEQIFTPDVPPCSSVDAICQHALKLPKDKAREVLPLIATYVYPSKLLEAIAIYHHGVSFEGVRVVRPVMAKSNQNVEKDVSCGPCTPYSLTDFHSYSSAPPCASPNEDAEDIADVQTDPTPTHSLHCRPSISKQKLGGCLRKSCAEEMQMLTNKIKQLACQVDNLEDKNRSLLAENSSLQKELKSTEQRNISLDKKVAEPPVSCDKIRDSDELTLLHTGLPSYRHFQWVLNEVLPAAEGMQYWKGNNTAKSKPTDDMQRRGPARSLSPENELLLTLMKLKLNIIEPYLAHLFNISTSLVSSILSTWIPLLAKELGGLLYWPSRQEASQSYPECFQKWTGITAILDCFEIPTEKPSHIDANSKIFSSYKNRPTVKFLLACTPGGAISFISPPAGGNMSDKEIVIKSNIIDKFSVGDKCMADKGFRISGELLERGVELILPPFVKGGKPFTEEENKANKAITHARIHVERVIGRLRDYTYLNGVIPLSQLDLVGPAAIVCCALTNLKNSVVPLK